MHVHVHVCACVSVGVRESGWVCAYVHACMHVCVSAYACMLRYELSVHATFASIDFFLF